MREEFGSCVARHLESGHPNSCTMANMIGMVMLATSICSSTGRLHTRTTVYPSFSSHAEDTSNHSRDINAPLALLNTLRKSRGALRKRHSCAVSESSSFIVGRSCGSGRGVGLRQRYVPAKLETRICKSTAAPKVEPYEEILVAGASLLRTDHITICCPQWYKKIDRSEVVQLPKLSGLVL